MERVKTLSIDRWSGPFEADLRERAVADLEAGCVLHLPKLAFALDGAELDLLMGVAAGGAEAKNVSYDPASGRCKGARLAPAAAERLGAILRRFAEGAESLILSLAPGYAPGLERARASFRPEEAAGRDLPWRKDDRRLHVDAFPSRPMRGKRILRVFANVNPEGAARRWRLGEPFEAHARRFLPQLRPSTAGQAQALALLGLTKGRRSRYDDLMLGLHDAAKRDLAYQEGADGQTYDFAPGGAWIVYTDVVPHAAMSGRYAFEQTFHLDPKFMADPTRAPAAILARLTNTADLTA